ncbi:MAG: phosphoribosylanthranilate isomerase [Anaerolineae bacterium]
MRVKICGITNIEDARVSADAGADLLGFIFYPKSPRRVSVEDARDIVARLRAAHADPPLMVGVFVDVEYQEVARTLDDVGLDLAQLSGSEPPLEVGLLAPRAFKAIRPQNRADADGIAAAYAEVLAPTDPATARRPSFLVDAYHPWRFGGTGRAADWNAARSLALRYPTLLAGGLTPDTVAEAVAEVQPWGVDVASGVESAPGKKDHDLVRRFITAAKQPIGADGQSHA